ncbi:hypothetical protein FHL15_001832 [Xylaria flabelliformis]|uniref:HORMA domain-containing protein n=1 Tax=Xylaria flabelliformis TaxID=2512241 RepID=A0A553IA10_9PEZI|nr:hypothetical protein FHL15_001832 [Xylaria flabelliformis]
MPPTTAEKDKSKVHKLSLKGSAKLVAEFFQYSIHTILYVNGNPPTSKPDTLTKQPTDSREVYTQPRTSQRANRHPFYPFSKSTQANCSRCYSTNRVKKYGLNMLVSADDQVKAYIKKIMSQLDRWMQHGKISKLVIVITDKDTGEHIERWQFDVQILASKPKKSSKSTTSAGSQENSSNGNGAGAGTTPLADPSKTEAEIQAEIAALFRQITASVTFLPQLSGDCTFNVLVYADADSEVPVEWGDSDAKEIVNGERVQLRGFSTSNHRVETLVSYRLGN